MIAIWMLACSTAEYVIPQADVFSGDSWEGSLSFHAFEGKQEVCQTVYGLLGEERACEDCIWEVSFVLESLSDACVYDDLELLVFRVGTDGEWYVLEESGWEQWGTAAESDGYWSFVSGYHFFP